MTLGLPDEVLKWVLGSLGTVAFSLIIYFLKENISAIKELGRVIVSFRTEFEVHKEHDTQVVKDVSKLQGEMLEVQREQVEAKLRVNNLDVAIKHMKQ